MFSRRVFGSASSPLGAQLADGMQAAAREARQGLTQSCYVNATDTQLSSIHDLVERSLTSP